MVVEELKVLLADKLGMDAKQISESSNIVEDLKADSLDMVEIAMSLEDRFGVKIPDDAMANFHTVGDLANYISAK